MSGEGAFSEMALPEMREKTFKRWPFKRGNCTTKEMAKAGFFQDTHDTISCYYCFKELEGWESTDVPFEEHKKHAPYCCFIQNFSKPPESLTVQEVCELELGRMQRKLELEKTELFTMIDSSINETVQLLPNMAQTKKPNRRRIYNK